jgi:tetratricopeptide (TPR) repeat protein
MNQKTFARKLTCTALLGLLCVISFQGCSTLRNFIATGSSVQNQYSENSRQQKAYHEFSSKIRAYQESPDSIYKRACYFQERKKHKLALLEFKRIIEIDSSHVMAYNGMGISYDSLELFTIAVDYYKGALALNPNLDYVYNNLGYSYLLQNDLDSSIEAFKKAIALKQNDKKYHNNLGIAYAKKGFFALAYEEFTLAANERAALHNLALFRDENYLDPQIIDGLAWLQSSEQTGGNDTDQMNLDSESAKSVSSKLNREIKAQEIETTLASSTQPNQESFQKSLGQKYETFYVQVATLKYLENATKVKENLARIGYRGDIDVVKRGNSPLYVVKVGGFNSGTDAEISAEKIEAELGINDLLISVNDTERPPEQKIKYTNKTDLHILPEAAKSKMPQIQNSIAEIGIEVSNGNGVNRMARKTAQYLEKKGYVISRVTNANHFNYAKTTIYYCEGYLQEANRLAQKIPGWNEMEKTEMPENLSIKIRVLIGKNLIPFARVLDRKKDKNYS